MKRPKTIRRQPALASGIPVFCKFDVIDHAEGLKPHPDNAHRSHPAKQLDAYELVIAGNPAKKGNNIFDSPPACYLFWRAWQKCWPSSRRIY